MTAPALKETAAGTRTPEPLERTVMSSHPTEPLGPTPMLSTGEVLGTYEITALLGRGGMGEVYAARHVRLGRKVALKVLRATHACRADLVERFFQEARAVNAINHEHIVEVYDFVEERAEGKAPRVYLVMELLGGVTLAEAMRQAALPVEQVLRVGAQVAEALAAAHRVGVVHRDVKPDNVFLTPRSGQSDFVKVLDFGVAKLEQTLGAVTPETMEGMVIGTPAYMSPEQASAAGTDGRSDIYSLGTLLYELLAGRLPFDAQNFVQLAMQVVSQPVPPLPERGVSGEAIPEPLRALVMACLEKDPVHRPAGMTEVAAALSRISPAPALDPAAAPSEPLRGFRPRTWLAAVAVALVLGLGAAVALSVGGESPTAPDTAPGSPISVSEPPPAAPVPEPVERAAEPAPALAAEAPPQHAESRAVVPARAAPPSKRSRQGSREPKAEAKSKSKSKELSKDAILDAYGQ